MAEVRAPDVDPVDAAATLRRVLAVSASVGTGLAGYGWLEARWYRCRHLHLPGVTRPGTRPVRILHLSDLHLSRAHPHLGAFVAGLADEDYDLAVVTGDLLGDVEMEDRVVSALEALVDRRPGLVVLGSNDSWAPTPRNPLSYFRGPSDGTGRGVRLDTPRLVAGLERTGWDVVGNEGGLVEVASGSVAVSALDDPHDPRTTLPSVAEIRPPDEAALLHLGLVHAPYVAALDRLVDAGVDLVLAGHTHGGQVRLPGVGALVDNCDLPLSQARGASTHRGVPLHVSVGLGTSRFAPVRFACRPEATLLTVLP